MEVKPQHLQHILSKEVISQWEYMSFILIGGIMTLYRVLDVFWLTISLFHTVNKLMLS
jgi:hypothetical protein